MTDVRKLIEVDGEAVLGYACGQCGRMYSKDYDGVDVAWQAEVCCHPNKCVACGKVISQYSRLCVDCFHVKTLSRAEIITEPYSGPVYHDKVEGDWGDGYSSNIEEFFASCADEGLEPPPYCYPCTSEHLRLDAYNILAQVLDDHYEDASDDVVGYDDLEAFIKQWNARQTVVTYRHDRSRVIVLDQARFEALIAAGSSS